MIAIAGMADPALTISRPARQPLTITILETPSLTLPHDSGTRRERAYRSAAALDAELRDRYDITIRGEEAGATADPCPVDSACIVVSDGARPRVFDSRNRVLGAVRVFSALTPNVAITRLDAPPAIHASALAVFDVYLEARGLAGRTTTIEVLDDGVAAGSASHTWGTNNDDDASAATLRVEWTPLATGLRDVRVVARASPDEATARDNEARAVVQVVQRPVSVLVYEPQPSWTATFVRRAIEADARFHVLTHTRVGPTQIASSKPLSLAAAALARENIAVAIVASPQLLDRSEIDALRRFVRQRGGSVVLLLDAPPSGEWASLLSLGAQERREAAPVAIGPLKAAEFIVLRPQDLATSALASAGADPVIVSRSLGHGRIVASGALDAWRYRAEGTQFDSFWRSLVADAAEAAGEPLVLTLSSNLAAPGEHVDIAVEWRSIDEPGESLEAEAVLHCANGATPVRLWPTGSRARFRGGFDAPSPGRCEVNVNVRPLATATAVLRVTEEPTGSMTSDDALSTAVAAFGGMVVDAGDEGPLVTRLRALASPQRVSTPVRVMRSPWWIVPFAAALGGEWWLRRRRGLL
jgi:hypothetical protein